MKMRDLMRLVESAGEDFDGFLYHASPSQNVEAIRTQGMPAGSYWGTYDIASYYAEDISDNGDEPHMFRVPLEAFAEAHLVPDQNGIDEPLTYTLGMSEDEVQEEWQASGQTWRDSLQIIGSVRYSVPVPASAILDAD